MPLNHPETIPHSQFMGKLSSMKPPLVPKRLGTAVGGMTENGYQAS